MKLKKLNLGSGDLLFPSWTNIDIKEVKNTSDNMYIKHDLKKGIPYDDNTIDIIYSSHFLEHLEPFSEAIVFLKDCKRALKTDGVLILSVPDFKKIANIYLSSPKEFFKEYNFQKGWFKATKSWSRRLGISIMHDHKMLYDIDSISEILLIAGFKEINKLDFEYFKQDSMKGITLTHINHSLIVQAT